MGYPHLFALTGNAVKNIGSRICQKLDGFELGPNSGAFGYHDRDRRMLLGSLRPEVPATSGSGLLALDYSSMYGHEVVVIQQRSDQALSTSLNRIGCRWGDSIGRLYF